MLPRWTDGRAVALLLTLAVAAPAAAQDFGLGAPLSASDWLSRKAPAPTPPSAWRPGQPTPPDAARKRRIGQPQRATGVDRPPVRATGQSAIRTPGRAPSGLGARSTPVAKSAAVPPVGVTRLSDSNPDAKGALPAAEAQLPADLWGNAQADALAAEIERLQPRLSATRGLLRRILTAQLAPPSGSAAGGEGRLFLARLDRLIASGWLPDAQALVQSAGAGDAARFARRFDLALYEGNAEPVCQKIGERPGLAPDLAARVYCLAQAGDWAAAALTLHGARDGGLIQPQTVALLERFLDDSTADLTDPLPDPRHVSPLEFRLFEAIGQPLPSGDLPLAFAWGDLNGNAGWKARIEAAERLARAAALDPQQLAAAYLDQRPAASGAVWDRAAAYQRLDAALSADDAAALSAELPAAEPLFAQAGLIAPLAALVAPRLPQQGLTPAAAEVAAHLRLLAGLPVADASGLPDSDRALVGTDSAALGSFPAGSPAALYAAALQDATPQPDAPPEGRGLALLRAIADVDAGLDGDTARASAGLRRMVELGQPADARRAAVELILTDHTGAARR